MSNLKAYIFSKWTFSSVGRASVLQTECRRFNPCKVHSFCSDCYKTPRKDNLAKNSLLRSEPGEKLITTKHFLRKLAQKVERWLWESEVTGSSPVFPIAIESQLS